MQESLLITYQTCYVVHRLTFVPGSFAVTLNLSATSVLTAERDQK